MTDSAPSPEKLQPLEGFRPRHTVCDRCGYEVRRIAIEAGAITCPECGRAIPYVFEPRRTSDRRWVTVLRLCVFAFTALTLTLLMLLALVRGLLF